MQLSREFETASVILANALTTLSMESDDDTIDSYITIIDTVLAKIERHIDTAYPDSILAKGQSEDKMEAFSDKISAKLKEISCIY